MTSTPRSAMGTNNSKMQSPKSVQLESSFDQLVDGMGLNTSEVSENSRSPTRRAPSVSCMTRSREEQQREAGGGARSPPPKSCFLERSASQNLDAASDKESPSSKGSNTNFGDSSGRRKPKGTKDSYPLIVFSSPSDGTLPASPVVRLLTHSEGEEGPSEAELNLSASQTTYGSSSAASSNAARSPRSPRQLDSALDQLLLE